MSRSERWSDLTSRAAVSVFEDFKGELWPKRTRIASFPGPSELRLIPINIVSYGVSAVLRTGTEGIGLGVYRRTFSSGPLCHWCDKSETAFLTCPKGYVSQRAADRKAVYQADRLRIGAQASRKNKVSDLQN
jgi:hypothetical protein